MKDKTEKFYLDDHGVMHGPECPVSKAAWAQNGGAGASGPAQVATPAYRDGWARIFGTAPAVGQA